MGAPATTGQLRNNIRDMKIGDYIGCRTVVSSSLTSANIYYFGEKAFTAQDEMPYIGLDSTVNGSSGYFYFIKVDKGLLVADRVVLNKVSWDKLNTSKYIQGIPWDSGNIIPAMTSNTTPSGVASASSIYSEASPAWRAFDKNVDLPWITADGVKKGWLSYEFTSSKVINAYAITAPSDASVAKQSPKDWTFEAFDSKLEEWVVLDTCMNQTGWTNKLKRMYLINNIKAYEKYRINITNNNGATITYIGELEMFDVSGTIRSLTGGVAYADANGNSSTTDKGFGAWPTNNEWDKYIVKFPHSKIQNGKTLDDVFHWQNIRTWTQDTAILAIAGASSARSARGYEDVQKFLSKGATAAEVQTGFRPVFEYKEV